MKAHKPLIVAGIMSGTSADGIDVALVRIAPRGPGLKLEFLAHRAFPFARALRQAVLAAMDARTISTADLARLNWRLGMAYAEAASAAVEHTGIRPDLIGCHGQTVYHQGKAAPYAGRRVACTWQLGEPALIAAKLGVPVISNFRPADMAAGGQGAPLVPLLDFVLFADPKRARVLQNIGGIGNLTVIPAGAGQDQVIAFDTGPGNMIVDALAQQLFGKPMDRNGWIAARGRVLESVVRARLREKFFRQPPPKSAGREQFGADYAGRLLAACRRESRRPEDAIATATALTAASIEDAVRRWALPRTTGAPIDFIASGGGARNAALMAMLRQRLAPLGCAVATSAATIPVEAKEAAAFALLAYQTRHHRPGNIPSATGAARPAILGQVTYV
jgi:anhydro-N-acetylmuramic acid kinase